MTVGRKYKRCQHWIKAVYKVGFGIRTPYQFLLDAKFCRAVVQHQIDPSTRLVVVLGGPVRLMVTNCVMVALKEEAKTLPTDSLAVEAHKFARGLELRRCRHDQPLTIVECLGSLLGQDNPHHYGIASNDEAVKIAARMIPGVPIIYIERVFPLLEAPTKLSMQALAIKENSKLSVPTAEISILQKGFGTSEENKEQSIHHHRRAKGPNPLSVKRSLKLKQDHPNPSLNSNDEGLKCSRRGKRRKVSSQSIIE